MADDLSYREKIVFGTLDLVVTAGTTDSKAEGGIVDFPVAVDALLASIATIAVQSGNFPNPRDARMFADSCGKGINHMMREIAAMNLSSLMEPIGETN
jgi:hypothetical protein